MTDKFLSGNLTNLDWLTIFIFLAVVIGVAIWVKFTESSKEGFFFAGRSMGWFVVMLGTFASLFSTVSFVAVPGEAYKNGLITFLTTPALLLCYPLAISIFLRFYVTIGNFTIYEYLEKRYNPALRFYGSFAFLFGSIIYGGMVLYAGSKVFYGLTGWDGRWVMLVIGIFTIAYCVTGGMKAVMMTNVVHGFMIAIGILAILFMVLKAADFNILNIYSYAADKGHGFNSLATSEFYHFDLHKRYGFWVLLWMALYQPIMTVSSDQAFIQRLMAAKNYKSAIIGVYGNLLISIPVVAMLYLIGVGISYFYGKGFGSLPAGMESDHIMGHFVSSTLPSPFPGIVVAGMLAALMSTIDATINTIANVVYSDWLERLNIVKKKSTYQMLICRTITVLAGGLCIGLAFLLIYAEKGTTTTVFEVIRVGGVAAGGPIFVAFTLGILSKRISGKAMLISLMVGWCINIIMPYLIYYSVAEEKRISFLWVSFPGIMTTVLLAFLLSIIWPNTKNLDGLTKWTLQKS